MEEMIMENEEKVIVPVCEKYALTIREAAAYYNIGIKKMRRLAETNIGKFSIVRGNKFLIIRSKFENFLENTSQV